MKTLSNFVLLFLFSMSLTACSAPVKLMVKKDINPPISSFKPDPGKSALVIMRAYTPFGGRVFTFIERKFIGEAEERTYFAKTDIEPGLRYVNVLTHNSEAESVRINFEKEKVYILQQATLLFPGRMFPKILISAFNAKGTSDDPVAGSTYFEMIPVTKEKALAQELTEAQYKEAIERAQVIFINKNGENELRLRTPDDL